MEDRLKKELTEDEISSGALPREEFLTEVKDLGQDNLQHGKEYGVKLGSSILKCEFNISGQIGEPSQTENLTFVSLTHQIDSGLKRGYAHSDIIDAIIRSISPHSNLRSYIEMLPDLGTYHFFCVWGGSEF